MKLYRVLDKQQFLEKKLQSSEKLLTYISKVNNINFDEEKDMLQTMIIEIQTELSKINEALNKVDVDIPL